MGNYEISRDPMKIQTPFEIEDDGLLDPFPTTKRLHHLNDVGHFSYMHFCLFLFGRFYDYCHLCFFSYLQGQLF